MTHMIQFVNNLSTFLTKTKKKTKKMCVSSFLHTIGTEIMVFQYISVQDKHKHNTTDKSLSI